MSEATREVALPLISGVAIIVMVFTPLLALQGLEGRLFSPVALTIAFALGAALLLSLTVVPTLSTYVLRSGSATEPWLVRKLHAGGVITEVEATRQWRRGEHQTTRPVRAFEPRGGHVRGRQPASQRKGRWRPLRS